MSTQARPSSVPGKTCDRDANPISELVARLRRQQEAPHWALADSGVILNLALERPVVWCRRGRRLRVAVAMAGRLGLATVVLYAVGLMRALGYRSAAGKRTGKRELDRISVFVGFGAGIEERLWSEFICENTAATKPVRVDSVTAGGVPSLYRPTIRELTAAVFRHGRNLLEAIDGMTDLDDLGRLEFKTAACRQLGAYSFYRVVWKGVKDRCTTAVFLAPDACAFAAVDAGVRCRFVQHGCIRRSILFPRFESAHCLTAAEADYVKAQLGHAEVTTRPACGTRVDRPNRVLLVASVYYPDSELRAMVQVIEWARREGLEVWVRRHPRERNDFWETQFDDIRIDDGKSDLKDCLQRLKPLFVVSWFSTALVEALQTGVIPVTVCDASSPDVRDMVYPLAHRSLSWPTDQGLMSRTCASESARLETLQRLEAGDPGPFT